ncbi:MAG TPA: extracellular solute-binding protein [Ruminiclostridium sp.]|nr:extracellular solute-binding protein [Ruminiclostridium sp.]
MLRKSKPILASVLSLVLIGSTFAGCTSNTGSAQSKGPVKLELFSTKTENINILKSIVSTYEKENKNVTITITSPGSNSAKTVLKTRMTKNDIPDIVAMGGDATYTEIESSGVFEDLSNEPYASKVQESYKKMVYDVQNKKEKKLYGVPYATNASGILYNVDIFKKYNISVPKTWDELIADCKTLQNNGVQPFEFPFKDAWTSLCPWNSMAPDLAPTGFLNDRMNGKTTFAATHKEIAQKYLDLIKFGQKDMLGTTYADGNKIFAEGKAAMMINGNWAISEFKKTNTNMNVNLFALPASNDKSKNYVTSGVDVLFSVSNDSKNVDAAKKFVEYMMKPETAQEYIKDQFAFSAIKGVTQNDSSVEGVKDDIANGKVTNFPDHYYPEGFSLQTLTQEFAKNAVDGMDEAKNIDNFLSKCDKEYDAAK